MSEETDPMADACARLNIQLAETTIECDQLRAELAEARKATAAALERAGIIEQREYLLNGQLRAANDALTKRLEEAGRLLGQCANGTNSAPFCPGCGKYRGTNGIEHGSWCPLQAFLAAPPQPVSAAEVRTGLSPRDLEICARPKCLSPRHYNIHDPERGGHVFVEPAAPEPAPAPLFDTSGPPRLHAGFALCVNDDCRERSLFGLRHAHGPNGRTQHLKDPPAAPAPIPDCLRTMTPEEQAAFKPLANEQIVDALARGQRDREAAEGHPTAPASAQGTGEPYQEEPGRDYRKERDAAYTERNRVVAGLAAMVLRAGGRAWLADHPDDPTWDPEWKTIVFIDGPTGQLSWHLHDSDKVHFLFLPRGENEWDGHTTEQKYNRVAALAPPFVSDYAPPQSAPVEEGEKP